MENGRITAADFQYYANSGNTVDESVLVRWIAFLPEIKIVAEKWKLLCFGHYRQLCENQWRIYRTKLILYHYSNILLFQVAEKILLHLDNAYNIPNLRGRSAACKTNLPSNTAFRGFGVPQCMLVVESMIDDVALKLGRMPEEVSVTKIYFALGPFASLCNIYY